EHAVAVALDGAIYDLVPQIGNPRDGRRDFYPLVERRNGPGVGPAAGSARHADAVLVHFRARAQVIQRSDAKPRLDAGRGIATAVPPPLPVSVRAVMPALDFAQLQGVNHEANVAI